MVCYENHFESLTQYHFVMLIIITCYIGFELAFFQMIFPTCVANTKALGNDADKLTGLIRVLNDMQKSNYFKLIFYQYNIRNPTVGYLLYWLG